MYFEEFMCFFKNDIRPFKSEASKICKKKIIYRKNYTNLQRQKPKHQKKMNIKVKKLLQ